jgi:predicted RNA-binding Zn ribbon-like protein
MKVGRYAAKIERSRGVGLGFPRDICYTHVVMTVAIVHDLPPEELRFHWESGRLCLDFVATVGERWRRSFERLLTPHDLARWMAETGILTPPPDASARQLAAGRALREAINRLARPGIAPDPGDREELNRWAARAPLAPQLTSEGNLVWAADLPVEAMFATIARDALDLLSGPLAGRIRECGAWDCALLFVDTSRPGRRRWCSTAGCGNRVRTKAYRQRRKEAR